jgi:molybdenum cofactor cytidylyltransferase
LNQPLDSNLVHRPERFAELADIKIGSQVDDESLLRVLLSSEGGLKNIPSGARRIVLLNQADTPALQSQALRMADQLLEGYSSVVIASLNSKPGEALVVREKIAGIILAAGGATRFATAGGLNMPKPLLIWRGEPFVCHVARHALQAGLQPVVVVTGFAAAQIEQVLTGMDLQIVRHMDWMQGQSSSIQAGLQALPRDTGAALFLLADQPQIPPTLIHSFVETHSRTFAPIIAPLIDGMRGNPVLFDRSTFSAFATLRGDVGGRVLFSRFPVEWIPWHDPHCLLDVDTPEDYHALLAFDDQ